MSQVHYEVYLRKPGAPSWTLEQATEERTRAVEVAEDLLKTGKASAVRVTKEILDDDTNQFKSVNILTKGDVGKADRKKVERAPAPLCISPQDLYTVHARDVIGRLLEGWLAREKSTAFELLHGADLMERLDAGMDLQHAIQKIAIPQAQDHSTSVHEIMRHFKTLAEATIERVMRDDRKGNFPDLEKESFASACERALNEAEPMYTLGCSVAKAMGKAGGWPDKVNCLLDLADSAPLTPRARALAFSVLEIPLAEIMGSKVGMAALLGPGLDLGGNVAAMTRLAAADLVDTLAAVEPTVARLMPVLDGAAARLGNWLEGDKFPALRTALSQRVLYELSQPRRLRPEDPDAEIALLRALAMCLTAAAGKHLPMEQVQSAFVERSKMMVRSDFMEAYIGSARTPLGEIEALATLAENITGPANKRAASRWIAAYVTGLKFERELRGSPETPPAKLASLASVQRSVSRVGFIAEELAPIVNKIGEIGGMIEADTKLIAAISRAKLPAASRLAVLLRMASGDTAPIGPVADRARAEVLKMTRSPEIRAELARTPEQLEMVRGLLQTAGMAA